MECGESAGFFGENGALSPVAGRGTGSTGLSRGTCRFHSREKCRVFLRKRFTFPRGSQGHRLHRPLSRHLPFPLPGKVPGISAKTVHFPPGPTGVPAPQAPLAALAVSTPGKSAGFSCENGSLSPVARRGTGYTGISAALGISTSGESAGNSRENGSLSHVVWEGQDIKWRH